MKPIKLNRVLINDNALPVDIAGHPEYDANIDARRMEILDVEAYATDVGIVFCGGEYGKVSVVPYSTITSCSFSDNMISEVLKDHSKIRQRNRVTPNERRPKEGAPGTTEA